MEVCIACVGRVEMPRCSPIGGINGPPHPVWTGSHHKQKIVKKKKNQFHLLITN